MIQIITEYKDSNIIKDFESFFELNVTAKDIDN